MIRAILGGKKTQTRRLVKPQPEWGGARAIAGISDGWYFPAPRCPGGILMADPAASDTLPKFCPYGAPGDRLWVRETFHGGGNGGAELAFRADYLIARDVKRWQPAIHMPRCLSRITLEVTGVRVERLQDISEEDAIAEGVDAVPLGDVPRQATWNRRQDFAQLWDSLNAKRATWASNPWVWVVEFRRAEAAARAA